MHELTGNKLNRISCSVGFQCRRDDCNDSIAFTYLFVIYAEPFIPSCVFK